jgi:hypothetical protein
MCFHSYCATLHAVAAVDLAQLGSETKGVLLALVALDAVETARTALAATEREPISDAWEALGRLPQDQKEGLLAQWRAEVMRVLPRGIEQLHPSWVEDVPLAEPAYLIERLRAVVPKGGRPVLDKLLARSSQMGATPTCASSVSDLARVAFGSLRPLCEGELGPLGEQMCAMPFERLVDEVVQVGARTLGRSLAGSDATVWARAMAMAGPPWAETIGRAVSEAVSQEDRAAAVAHVAGQVDTLSRTPSERLLAIGLRELKTMLSAEQPGSLARVAGRLPVALGRRLLGW